MFDFHSGDYRRASFNLVAFPQQVSFSGSFVRDEVRRGRGNGRLYTWRQLPGCL